MTATSVRAGSRPARYSEADCRLADFAEIVDQSPQPSDYPHAVGVEENVLIYDSAALRYAAAES
jgi:hypothetical protein